MNVVSNERCLKWTLSQMNVVSNERCLKWTWSQMNVVSNERGLKWTWSQTNVVSNERGLKWTWSQMNVVSNECGLNCLHTDITTWVFSQIKAAGTILFLRRATTFCYCSQSNNCINYFISQPTLTLCLLHCRQRPTCEEHVNSAYSVCAIKPRYGQVFIPITGINNYCAV